MKRKRLLDSYALLAYLDKETGYQKVQELLTGVQKAEKAVLMNEINVGEVYYILCKKRGREKADYFLETVLPALPVKTVSNTFADVIDAAKIKAQYPISFADCFAAALARKEDASIITGDREFKKIEHLVTIEWIITV